MPGKFSVTILDVETVIYKSEEVTNLFVPGEEGEFEILSCHYPIMSLLKKGNIIINWKEIISINRGILKFLRNDCIAVVELSD